MADWLTLQEYSNQQGVSISTLRRKIKGGEIKSRIQNGRYLLKVPYPLEDSLPKNELKAYYQKLLCQKDKELKKLKEDREDLIHLLDFLEEEKTDLLNLLNKAHWD